MATLSLTSQQITIMTVAFSWILLDLQQKPTTEENGVKKSSQIYLRMNGDVVGALLEQKLKEISLQVENEAATGFTPSARTTASILQELISALTADKLDSSEEGSHKTDTLGSQCDSEATDIDFQTKIMTIYWSKASQIYCKHTPNRQSLKLREEKVSRSSTFWNALVEFVLKPPDGGPPSLRE